LSFVFPLSEEGKQEQSSNHQFDFSLDRIKINVTFFRRDVTDILVFF